MDEKEVNKCGAYAKYILKLIRVLHEEKSHALHKHKEKSLWVDVLRRELELNGLSLADIGTSDEEVASFTSA